MLNQLQAEKEEAVFKLVTNVVAAVAGAVANAASAGMAAPISGIMTSAGDVYSKHAGPQKDANDATLREKDAELQAEMADQMVQEAEHSVEGARDQIKRAFDLINGHIDRQLAINNKITSIS